MNYLSKSMYYGITYYSIGALIISSFNVFLILSFIGTKSKKYYTTILKYFFILFLPTNLSYFFASIIVHPILAYYRWFTVPSVFISYSILIFFILIYGAEDKKIAFKFKKFFFIFLSLVSIILSVYFWLKTYNQKVIYIFSGHNYELLVPDINKIIFNFLISMLILMFLSVMYKTVSFASYFFKQDIIQEDKQKSLLKIIFIWILFLTQLIPTITNILSATKIIDRGLHYLIFVTTIILGFSFALFIYNNLEKEETSILHKINSISIITILLMTQFVTYFMLKEIEENFLKLNYIKFTNLVTMFNEESFSTSNVLFEKPIAIYNVQNKKFQFFDFNNYNKELLNEFEKIENSENKSLFYQLKNFLIIRIQLQEDKIVYISYFYLRKFLHEHSFKIFFLLIFFIILVLAFFPIFYRLEIVRIIEEMIQKIQYIEKNKEYSIQIKKFYNDELGVITDAFNKMINSLKESYNQLIEYSKELEIKVQERSEELKEQIQIVNKLKEQQDGDYFLTSLLTKVLVKYHLKPNKTDINLFSYIKQARSFAFKNKVGSIGGDNIIVDRILLYNLPRKKIDSFVVGSISDAAGTSMHGALGSIVFSVVFFSFLKNLKKQSVIKKEIEVLQECYYVLQRVFLSFNKEMTCSSIIFILNERTREIFYINLDFPNTVIIRTLKNEEIIEIISKEDEKMPSLGFDHPDSLKIQKYKLRDNEKILFFSDGVLFLDFLNNNKKKYNFLEAIIEHKLNFLEIIKKIDTMNKLEDDICFLVLEINKQSIQQKFLSKNVLLESIRKDEQMFVKNLLFKLESIVDLDITLCIDLATYYYFKKFYNTTKIILEYIYKLDINNIATKELLMILNLSFKLFLRLGKFEHKFNEYISNLILLISKKLIDNKERNYNVKFLVRVINNLKRNKVLKHPYDVQVQEKLSLLSSKFL